MLEIYGKFIEELKWYEFYGYEIYHKEVTFADNYVKAEKGLADDANPICHLQVSWIRLR
jgi:hypothetical protein